MTDNIVPKRIGERKMWIIIVALIGVTLMVCAALWAITSLRALGDDYMSHVQFLSLFTTILDVAKYGYAAILTIGIGGNLLAKWKGQ